ncbi:hypothetical protein FACS1894195_1420 [Bacteroidia bacterium]|nr:hypothetical protein FACS1894195_1420 [Bacteroidia bacterium]
MIKLRVELLVIALLLLSLAASAYVSITESRENNRLKRERLVMSEQLSKALDAKTYNISLNPTVNSKVTSALGSTRQVEFHYHFQMDGNTIEMQPDSTIVLRR